MISGGLPVFAVDDGEECYYFQRLEMVYRFVKNNLEHVQPVTEPK